MGPTASPVQGVYAAALTPRRDGEAAVDLAAALDLIDFLGRSGVDGIALLGSTGEFLHFDLGDRRHLIKFALKRSPVPVVVNASHSTIDGALNLAREAASDGAAGVLLLPPHFFRYSQQEIRAFYLQFAEDMEAETPILLYNVPEHAGAIHVDTAIELLSTGRFAGIKDSSGHLDDLLRLRAVRERVPFRLLVGNDRILAPAREAGADGAVSGVASAAPELVCGLDRAVRNGQVELRQRLEARLHEFLAWVDRFPTPVAIREGARARGIKTGPHAVPLGDTGQRHLEEFREWFPGWWRSVEQELGRI